MTKTNVLISLLPLWMTIGHADELPQPENLTLSRKPDHFSVTAEWSKPSGLDADCTVNYTVELYLEKCPPSSTALSSYTDKRQTVSLEYNFDAPNQREICVVVQTNPKQCGNKTPSRPVYKSISPPPALVKNFTCVYYARMKMNCTWSVISDSSDLQLFYKRKDSESLKPCISYITSEHMKTGCHLDDIDISTHDTFFKISGTDSETVNTFIIEPRNSVKAEPPKLNISRRGENLFLSSSTPYFLPKCWKFKFNYSKCNEEKEVVSEEETIRLEYDAACKYTAQVQTIFTPNCGRETESEMSEPVYYPFIPLQTFCISKSF